MAKDIYRDTVRTALQKDGWTITNDPLKLTIGNRSVYVDLEAEKLLAAGIPKDKIVLAFHPPDVRKYTEFAVAQILVARQFWVPAYIRYRTRPTQLELMKGVR